MARFLLRVAYILSVFLAVNLPVLAVEIAVSGVPSVISNDPFTLSVVISGAQAGNNYLRIDLYKEGSTSYFGETYNGTDWQHDTNYDYYLPITIISGAPWSGQIQGRIGTIVENGSYKLKVRRYTSQGSYSFSNPIEVNIDISNPTPTTATAQAELTETPSPTPTEAISTAPQITPSPSQQPTPTQMPTQMPTPTQTITPQLITYANIYLSEVMTYPLASENEWVEIYNANDFAVSLQNWLLDDAENSGSSPKSFSLDLPAKSYGIINLSSSIFNNNNDQVRLLDSNKNLKDSFEYTNSTQGKSIGRSDFENDNYCLQEPSKNFLNHPCLNPTNTPEPTPKNTVTPTRSPTATHAPTPQKPTASVVNKTANTRPIQPIEQNITNQTVQNNDFFTQQGKVLSINTRNNNLKSPLIKSLSFFSLSYSLLTVFSVIFKIKSVL